MKYKEWINELNKIKGKKINIKSGIFYEKFDLDFLKSCY